MMYEARPVKSGILMRNFGTGMLYQRRNAVLQQRTIAFNEEDLEILERVAAREGRSIDEIVREAVHNLMAGRAPDDAEWRSRFDDVVTRIQRRIPDAVTSEEIEADARVARKEVRELRRARND